LTLDVDSWHDVTIWISTIPFQSIFKSLIHLVSFSLTSTNSWRSRSAWWSLSPLASKSWCQILLANIHSHWIIIVLK
jgi:hypothetical protein